MGTHALTRRSFLVAGAGLAGAAAVGGAAGLISPATRAVASGAPTTADFQNLQASISGKVVLPGASDYQSALELFDPIYDTERPLAVVQPATVADVATTVNFASGYSTPFAPRSGGHSYVGASGGDQGIQLDLRNLNSIVYNTGNQTVTVGAGAILYDVHTTLEPYTKTVPTGTCPTVGVSGLTLGGGIGIEDREYGLTCDALQQIQVVLANGSTVTASATQYSDLFFACRGGGGGNFGVVTSYTFATYAAMNVGYATLQWTDANMEKVIAGWQARIPQAPGTSWTVLHLTTGSGHVTPTMIVFTLGTAATTEVNALISAVGVTPASQSTTMYTHLQAIQKLAGCTNYTVAQCQQQPAGKLPREIYLSGSDVLGSALTSSEISAIAAYLRSWAKTNSSTTLYFEPFGGAIANTAVSATAFPWRTALGSVQWRVNYTSAPSSSVKTATYNWISTGHTKFGSASVGAYINYLEPTRPLSAYYGSNYTQLQQLRAKYDPNGLFHGTYVIPAA